MLTHLKITGIHVLDQDEAIEFYVDKLGLELRTDADLGFMRWVTAGVPGDSDREIMLDKPTQQAYGVDFGFRDPFGNAIRIGQTSGGSGDLTGS